MMLYYFIDITSYDVEKGITIKKNEEKKLIVSNGVQIGLCDSSSQ